MSQINEVQNSTSATSQPEQTKPLRLTKKDREVIEYFFTHFQPDGFIIHHPEKEIPPQERLTYQEKESTTLDLAKVVNDAQLGPVKVTLHFFKKDPSEARLIKKDDDPDYKSYVMDDDPENKVYLSKWGKGYDWGLEASTLFDADDIKLPGFKEYLKERYLSPPTEHERLLSEHTLDSLRDIAAIAKIIKSIIASLTGEKAVNTVCSNEFNKVLDELEALQKKQEDRRLFRPVVDGMKDDTEPQATV